MLDAIANVKLGTNNSGEQSKPTEDIIIGSVKVYKVTVSTAESAENSSSGANNPVSTPAPASSKPESVPTSEPDAATIETGDNAA